MSKTFYHPTKVDAFFNFIREITIADNGIVFRTMKGDFTYKWSEIKRAYLYRKEGYPIRSIRSIKIYETLFMETIGRTYKINIKYSQFENSKGLLEELNKYYHVEILPVVKMAKAKVVFNKSILVVSFGYFVVLALLSLFRKPLVAIPFLLLLVVLILPKKYRKIKVW